MFIAVNRIQVKRGEGSELEARFAQSRGIEKMPGFRCFRLLKWTWGMTRPEHDEYLSVTEWDSPEAFQAWTKSDAFRQAHAGPKIDAIVGSQPGGYEVLTERGPE